MDYLFEKYSLDGCILTDSCFVFEKAGGSILFDLDSLNVKSYKYLIFDIENNEDFSICLNIRVWEDHIEKPCDLFVAIGILPSIKTTVCIPLDYLNGHILFGKRQQGILKTVVKGNKINFDKLKVLSISLPEYHKNSTLCIHNIRLSNDEIIPDINSATLIDELGQYQNKNWIGKTKDLSESKVYLSNLLNEAERFLSNHADEYFGYKEKQFEATGFFRIEKEADGRYWMVTPDGYGFFGIGIDCVRPNASGPIDHEGNIRDFLISNLSNAFGDSWYECWCKITKYRLIKWKINTIGAWSDIDFAQNAKIPYVAMLSDYPNTVDNIYRDFPDVFSPVYKKKSDEYACQLSKYIDDSYLIGYFMSNEPNWAFVDHLNLGYELVRNKKELHSKSYLICFMKEKYNNSIEELNEAWYLKLDTFENLGYMGEFPEISKEGISALEEFSKIMITEYIKVPALALKKVDPNHLNLGIRYAYISSAALYSGSEYFDVFSINSYEKTCNTPVNEVFDKVHMPIMIGEFHFGAIDRGLPATGIRGVSNQEERGKSIRHYIEESATLKACQGIHYFQYNDQPFLGRFDGENYNIGLVDICNKEYPEVVEQLIIANERLYEIVEGKGIPDNLKIDYIPAIFY